METTLSTMLKVLCGAFTVCVDLAAMPSCGVGPLGFTKSRVKAANYQEIMEHFMLPFTDELYGDVIFHHHLAPAHTAESTNTWFKNPGIIVSLYIVSLPDLRHKENDVSLKNAEGLKVVTEAPWSSITSQ